MNRERQIQAANRIEHLVPGALEIVKRLREGVSDDQAYALVYQLRYEFGQIVWPLGAGAPKHHSRVWANDVIAQQTEETA